MGSLLDSKALLMPQVLKEEMRARILAAALEEFASRGYPATTMASIAARAGTGAAGLYRYFESKEALFAAVVPAPIARSFESLLSRRVRSLAAAAGAKEDTGDEMLAFWEAHRLAVVILLDRAEGTPYEHFGARFVDQLVDLTSAEFRRATPGLVMDAPTRFVLRRIFENTRSMIASILEAHEDSANMRSAIAAFWAYQIAGLQGFARRATKGRAPRSRSTRA